MPVWEVQELPAPAAWWLDLDPRPWLLHPHGVQACQQYLLAQCNELFEDKKTRHPADFSRCSIWWNCWLKSQNRLFQFWRFDNSGSSFHAFMLAIFFFFFFFNNPPKDQTDLLIMRVCRQVFEIRLFWESESLQWWALSWDIWKGLSEIRLFFREWELQPYLSMFQSLC